MVSQGDDPKLFGTRNAPTMLYASYAPEFHYDEKIQDYVGGQFWDGRAKDLAEQAGGPPVNPVEMGMPDKKSIVERLKANQFITRQLRIFMVKAFGQMPTKSMPLWKKPLRSSKSMNYCAILFKI